LDPPLMATAIISWSTLKDPPPSIWGTLGQEFEE